MTTAPAPGSVEDTGLAPRQVLLVMAGLLAALFTAMISTTIVATALPTIMGSLGGTQRQYTWVITASLLTMTIATPLWGKLSDLFDKKILTQISITLFVAGSVAAGFAQGISLLMGARAVQGIAMGGLIALTQSVMGTIITPRDRGKYAGYMGAVMAVATVSGPLLGGVITDHLGWRWTFFVSVPLAVIAVVVIQLTLHMPAAPRDAKPQIDYLGAVLLSVAAALPMLWVTFAGDDYDWISWQSGAYLIAFLVVAAATVVVELRVPEPVLPLRVLNNRTSVMMIVASVFVGVAMFGSAVFLTQYFQLGAGHSPTKAGMMTIPMILTQLLSATIGGQIVSRTGRWKPVMVFGGAVMVAGLAGLATIDHSTTYPAVALYMALLGLGMGTLMQNTVLAVQNTVDVRDIGAASAAVAFFRSLGGAVGVSILGAVLASLVSTNVREGMTAAGIPTDQLDTGADVNLDISALPAPMQDLIHSAYADGFGPIFLISAIAGAVTLLAILTVRGTMLRQTIGLAPIQPAPGTDGAGAPAAETETPAPQATSAAADTAAETAEPDPDTEVRVR